MMRSSLLGDADFGGRARDHAWFAAYSPAKAPEIAVVVLVEHGGFGAKASAPTAMEIYEAYFHKEHYVPKKTRAKQAEPEAEPEAEPAAETAANGAWH